MSPTGTHTGTRTHRLLGVVAALALVLGLAVAPAVPAGAQDAVEVQRIDGGQDTPADVRATAIQACQAVTSDSALARRVLVSRDDAFADALVAAPLAGDDGCILFTGAGEQPLDPRVRAEIDRVLAPGGEVGLLGGVAAVGQVVEDELTSAGFTVRRFAGDTRYETAAAIAEAVRAEAEPGLFTEVVLAYGEDWPDAVTVGAYAAAQGVPIVLTQTNTLHPAADAFLQAGPPVDRTTVVGGTAVISEAAAQAAPAPQRFAGDNRMGTAAAITSSLWPTADQTPASFVLVNLEHPDAWTVALAAAPLSARRGAPQLGAATDRLPAETADYLDTVGTEGLEDPPSIVVMGDVSFVSQSVADLVAERLGGSTATSCDPASSQVGVEPPVDATRVQQVVGDLDGDGLPDHLTTYATEDASGGEDFFLHVRLANDFAAETQLDADSIADVRPLGTATIGEGRPVAFVVEQTGASTVNVSLFGLHDFIDDPCDLGRVTIGDHAVPPQFPVYSGNGLQCRDVDADGVHELVARQVRPTNAEQTEFEWTEQAYSWPGFGALRTVLTDSGTFTSPEDDEEIQSFSDLDCPGVEAP